MTKREKREVDVRRNPADVRFDDLDAVLRGVQFRQAQRRLAPFHLPPPVAHAARQHPRSRRQGEADIRAASNRRH